jgi:hypothetical protein
VPPPHQLRLQSYPNLCSANPAFWIFIRKYSKTNRQPYRRKRKR